MRRNSFKPPVPGHLINPVDIKDKQAYKNDSISTASKLKSDEENPLQAKVNSYDLDNIEEDFDDCTPAKKDNNLTFIKSQMEILEEKNSDSEIDEYPIELGRFNKPDAPFKKETEGQINGYQRLSTVPLEYFGDDARDKERMTQMNNNFFYHEHTVNFSIPQYLETLVIHLLGFTVLGPFISIYSFIFYKSAPWLMHNLQFSWIASRGFWI